jgi:hypothetical protein
MDESFTSQTSERRASEGGYKAQYKELRQKYKMLKEAAKEEMNKN